MAHESRLTAAVRRVLKSRRTAALGTLSSDGGPHVSMVPFAVDSTQARLILLISQLAAHTRHIARDPRVSLLITEAENADEPVHQLGRITLVGEACCIQRDTVEHDNCEQVYLRRFPEAENIALLPDFRYVSMYVQAVRQIAGFGAARDMPAEDFERLLRSI